MNKLVLPEDWILKIFSLGVAALLFLFVSVEEATNIDVDFPIDYQLADDMMITNDVPRLLHVTLQGPWASLRSFTIGDMEPVIVDLSKTEPGPIRHVITADNVRSPGGMRIITVRPSELDIVLERRIERQLPVHADLRESPAFGFTVLDVRIVPDKVRVIGPATKMLATEFVTTRSIDIRDREEDLSLEVEIRTPPPPLRLLDKRVTVLVEIGEEISQRTINNVPIELLGAPKGAKAELDSVQIVLKGPKRILEQYTQQSMVAQIHIAADNLPVDEQGKEYSMQLMPPLPEQIQMLAPNSKIRVVPTPKSRRRR